MPPVNVKVYELPANLFEWIDVVRILDLAIAMAELEANNPGNEAPFSLGNDGTKMLSKMLSQNALKNAQKEPEAGADNHIAGFMLPGDLEFRDVGSIDLSQW